MTAADLRARRSSVTASPQSDDAGYSGSGFLLGLFILTLLLPMHINAGGLRLDPYRIILIAVYLPFLARLFTGAAGRVTGVDKLMFLYCFWIILTITYNNGFERLPFSIAWALELSGGYLLGRALVRNVHDYKRFVRLHVIAIFALAPFAFYELFTGRMPITNFLSQFVPSVKKNLAEARFGLSRVQVVFPHAILFGLFCSLAVANIYYVFRAKFFRMGLMLVATVAVTFTSLSSAPLLSVLLQAILTVWDKVTKGSWKVLLVLTAIAYVTIDSLSNRSPMTVLVDRLTLDPTTAYFRIHIFRYGMENVWSHPFLGLGLNDWARPSWLTASVDNFWLLNAMRHGIPGFLLVAGAFALHVRLIVKTQGLNEDERKIRTGYLIALIGLCFTLITVHVWDALAVFIMMYLGAGSFFYTQLRSPDAAEPDAQEDPAGGGENRRSFRPRRGRPSEPTKPPAETGGTQRYLPKRPAK